MRLLTLEQFVNHFQGHRRLTIRTIQAFPATELFSYKVEPLRSFGEMMNEVLAVEAYTFNGIRSGKWVWQPGEQADSKEGLLAAFEQAAARSTAWAQLSLERVEAVETDNWQLTWSNRERLLYMLDNEIHHRAQGYVYLRLLGLEPPAFYQR